MSPAIAQASDFDFGIYSNVDFGISDRHGDEAAFAVGGVDFFISGALGEHIKVLSEDVLEIQGGAAKFDLERLNIEYEIGPWLRIMAGREHMPLGYYAQAFHHGLLFQLTTARPALLGFEDEGGLMPAHFIGLLLRGNVALGSAGNLKYDLGIGNGRGQFADDVLSTFDRNSFKAIVARLAFQPEALEGFEIGVSGYFDQIPKGFTNDTIQIDKEIDEAIVAAHVVYRSDLIDAIAEFYYLSHSGGGMDKSTSLKGTYVQLGVTHDIWTPYARFDWFERDAEDVFFNASNAPAKATDVRAGLRISLHPQAVLKLEYMHDFENDINAATVQTAFGL